MINSNTKMYRGFTIEEILLLSEKRGQGEAMSKQNAKGLFAAIEWIDAFHEREGNRVPKEPFPWYTFDKLYPELVDRSIGY
jgi:hypothetical protein